MRRRTYLRYVEARLMDWVLYADEVLKYGFCLNVTKTSLCSLEFFNDVQEAVRDDDIDFNGIPSTESFQVFNEISKYWKKRVITPVIITLAKGVEAEFEPHPWIVTHV